MEDIEPPSFSLGFDLDLDLDSNPQPDLTNEPIRTRHPGTPIHISSPSTGNDENFDPETIDQNLRVEDTPSPPAVLKRLKRGLQTQSSLSKKKVVFPSPNLEDEIEDFSSEEEPCGGKLECSSLKNGSLCSSSTFPLHGHKVLMTQSVSKPKIRKTTPASSAPVSTNLEATMNKQIFPKLTISPLRKFMLRDSDSDEPLSSEDLHDKSNKTTTLQKEKASQDHSLKMSQQNREKSSATKSTLQEDDLWKDFCPKKVVNIQTPALDEFCEEYFMSARNKNVGLRNMENKSLNSKMCLQKNSVSDFAVPCFNDSLPPAHHYFYHEDPRIQRLVRERLPKFCPLGVVDTGENMHSGAAALDYRSQFGHGKSSSMLHHNKNMDLEGSSNRGKRKPESLENPKSRKSKSSRAKTTTQASQGWTDPRSSTSIPKDAGKRRVQADGQSAGHWFTGQDGRKVYVSKSGQEFTGQTAYRQYRKESGQSFRKKTWSKK